MNLNFEDLCLNAMETALTGTNRLVTRIRKELEVRSMFEHPAELTVYIGIYGTSVTIEIAAAPS